MKKTVSGIFLALMCFLLWTAAFADGVTIRTYTPFADEDAAAQTYNDLMESWSAETGNVIEDYSGLQDEQFMQELAAELANGNVDLMVIPVDSGLDTTLLVDASTLASAAPDIGIRVMNGMAEGNGTVLLAPVRFNWESLYVNVRIFEAAGLPVPESFEDLVVDCLMLSQMGIQPIANGLAEWAESALDCMALMGAPEGVYGTDESLSGAENVLTSLVLVNAFGTDPWNVSDVEMEELFLTGNAAMRFDTSDLALSIPEETADQYKVIALPGMDGTVRTALVGSPDCGLVLSKACFEDEKRREAAISFAKALFASQIAGENAGGLAESIAALNQNATEIIGVLYDKIPDQFETWSERVISSLMQMTAQTEGLTEAQ